MIGHVSTHDLERDVGRKSGADQSVDANQCGKEFGLMPWAQCNSRQKEYACEMENDRAHKSARRRLPLPSQEPGAARDCNEQQCKEKRSCRSYQHVEVVPFLQRADYRHEWASLSAITSRGASRRYSQVTTYR